MSLTEFEQHLAELTRAEKARLLQLLLRELGDAFPGIDVRADVCGGEPCVVRTRIPVWVLEKMRQLGASEAQILAAYPALRWEDLIEAWAFVRAHRDEIDQQIGDNEAA
jgi:uncharacterized protein (DUF433 family)